MYMFVTSLLNFIYEYKPKNFPKENGLNKFMYNYLL